jgi:hypothetical protein
MSRWRVALNTKLLDDLEKQSLGATIVKMAPQSALYGIPAIAASVAAIKTKTAALKAGNDSVDADEKQLKADIAIRDTARLGLDTELVTLKSLLVNNATQASDITGLGFGIIDLPQSTAQPDLPVVTVTMSQKHGSAKVSVVGGTGKRFLAEAAPDPNAGPWTLLPGTGRSRRFKGLASGTKIWVRFAQVRYNQQSAWSIAVLVSIP